MLKHTPGAEWWVMPTHKWHPSLAYLIGTPHFCVVLYRPGGKEWTSPIPEEAEAVAKLLSEAPTMYEALKNLLADMPIFECQDLHHAKADRHDSEDCPVESRMRRSIATAREILTRLESE